MRSSVRAQEGRTGRTCLSWLLRDCVHPSSPRQVRDVNGPGPAANQAAAAQNQEQVEADDQELCTPQRGSLGIQQCCLVPLTKTRHRPTCRISCKATCPVTRSIGGNMLLSKPQSQRSQSLRRLSTIQGVV